MADGASVLIANAPGNLLLPVLPLRDSCLFPEASLTTVVNRPPVIAAVEVAGRSSKCLLAVAQRDASTPIPNPRDLQGVGTLAFVTEEIRHAADLDVDLVSRAGANCLLVGRIGFSCSRHQGVLQRAKESLDESHGNS